MQIKETQVRKLNELIKDAEADDEVLNKLNDEIAKETKVEGQHTGLLHGIQRMAQRVHGTLRVEFQRCLGGLFAQVAIAAAQVAAQRGYVQQMDGSAGCPGGRGCLQVLRHGGVHG